MTLYDSDNFPMHMNLALRHHLQHQVPYQAAAAPPGIVNRLKQQNQQLSDEIVQQNEKVAVLEREKATLIHDLIQLQQRSRPNGTTPSGLNDSIF